MVQEDLLSRCYFHWLNKETALAQLIGQTQVGRKHRTEFWEEEGSVVDAMALLSEMDAGYTHAGKPQSSGDTH